MSDQSFYDGRVELLAGDCLERLKGLPDNSIDAVATDPPYHLTSIVKRFGGEKAAAAKDYSGERDGATGAYARASKGFMGKTWDGGDIAFRVELWAEVFRVLKPGGHLVAFSGTRTYHRMTVAIEDAGFEVRDMIAWLYGVGFPKSLDISRAIDKAAGFQRGTSRDLRNGPNTNPDSKGDKYSGFPNTGIAEIDKGPVTQEAAAWEGWGTALKPALEPICFARKPISESSIAANVLKWGTGVINIDATRIPTGDKLGGGGEKAETLGQFSNEGWRRPWMDDPEKAAAFAAKTRANVAKSQDLGRFPANLAHDGSAEVLAAFPNSEVSGSAKSGGHSDARPVGIFGARSQGTLHNDSGSAARFFYSAKADADDRLGSGHPTVKPLDLMRWLVRLITPPGGRVLDPFGGTGTTSHAALLEGFSAVTIEREDAYRADIARRLENAFAADRERREIIAKAKNKVKAPGALFELADRGA